VVLVLALALASAGCTGDSDGPPSSTPSTSAPANPPLTFGVFGPHEETAAFQETVDAWNAKPDVSDVTLKTWPDRASMRSAIEGGAAIPDVFLASRSDLSWLLENGYTQPVDDLLDERNVDFGDGYSRDALQAFSTDDRLQCMPYAVSPMVIYYNTSLVDFTKMRNRGLDAPDEDATDWNSDQFSAAAEFASRPARGAKGVHIAPTLAGLSPFIESGGGSVFDDYDDPKSLSFSSDGSKSALERTLELLRRPQVTLDESQLASASPLKWFIRGKLGMIAGYRSLVPQLRLIPGLNFDVMPMPVLDSSATVGDVSGLCLSAKAASTAAGADFMVHELADESVATVTRTGYLAPANLAVALSDDFLQPGRQPEHANFFNSTVRSMRFSPLIDTISALEATVQPSLEDLVYGVGVLDLDAVTQEIDDESKTVLDPESVSPSPSDSESPSD